ncbi:penicillin-binding protein [Corynebacterium aquilae DSM 44791]|uniref:Penicillin-binding protein n=1 Tax=Corynebacterium aquilae DSM 44791 TaxID=1431546 RepID=A0A1L7CDF4_9CORY|nr:penicillin-binding protein [Corynebacterium aquilae DSM 44791]
MSIITGTVVTAGLVGAVGLAPAATVAGVGISRTQETMESNLADLTDGSAPGVTTLLDANDEPIAWLYKQRRFDVAPDQIAPIMKQAIVSVEDRRFYEHPGVDWQGTARAMVKNIFSGSVQEGASTIDQQYVKNYLLLVDAEDEAEQVAATEQSIPRKLREMRMASDLDKRLSKDEILTRYLNIVPFGNGAYGIEAAARTYFGSHASDLTPLQAATLAGIVQSSSVLNPYTNPEGVIERRNTVLDTMAETGALPVEEVQALKQEPLGVQEVPTGLPNGCITAGNKGFFCDYVIDYLAKKDLPKDKLFTGGYTIHTTLDPAIQEMTHNAVTAQVSPTTPGAAEVLNVVQPGADTRRVLAMTSSRNYGLNLDEGETVLPQPFTRVGAGAGSVFKVFTAATAIERGMGIDNILNVPPRYNAQGMGEGGAPNCPPGYYCVENAGVYRPSMTLRDALAQSPNTTFVQLIQQVGVPAVVDMAVRLGLRDYEDPGSFDGESSIAQYMIDHNLGSFTLGPTAVNPLELSNVAATLASNGVWCEPSPIERITDRNGNDVPIDSPPCEQVIDEGVAHALANAMSSDMVNGTASEAAKNMGWGAPTAGKTGTTETHQSAAFMGFNSNFAAVPYIYNDGTTVAPLCTSPLRQCQEGTLYGGMEPARTWIGLAETLGWPAEGIIPPYDPIYNTGTATQDIPRVTGLAEADARKRLERAGYRVRTEFVPGNGMPKGRAVGVNTAGVTMKGQEVVLQLSDGTKPPTPTPTPRVQRPTSTQAPAPANDPVADLASAVDEAVNQLLQNTGQ